MPTMDYSKLRGRIKECGYTQKSLAESIGISKALLPEAYWQISV